MTFQHQMADNIAAIRSPYFETSYTSYTRPSDTTAYAANDALSNSTSAPTALTFSDVAGSNGGSFVITGVELVQTANQATAPSLELWLFDTSPTAINDNSAFTLTDAEMETVVAILTPTTNSYVGNATSGDGGNVLFNHMDINRYGKCASDSTSLYGLVKVKNAYTPVSGELFKFRIKGIRL